MYKIKTNKLVGLLSIFLISIISCGSDRQYEYEQDLFYLKKNTSDDDLVIISRRLIASNPNALIHLRGLSEISEFREIVIEKNEYKTYSFTLDVIDVDTSRIRIGESRTVWEILIKSENVISSEIKKIKE